MSFKTANILELETFKAAKLLTDPFSLDHEVRSVSVSDCPLYDDLLQQNIFEMGDFYISSLNLYEDKPHALLAAIDVLIRAKSSGLCITDEYYQNVPEEVITHCNKHSFPLIQISKNISYAQMIKAITESILREKSTLIKVNMINELLQGHADISEKLKIINQLNMQFENNGIAFYITSKEKFPFRDSFISNINHNHLWFAIPYSAGILAILSFKTDNDDKRITNSNTLIGYVMDQLKGSGEIYIGVSNTYNELLGIGDAIREALFANKTAQYTSQSILKYDEIGSMRLLIAMNNHPELNNYYKATLKKIIDFDHSNQSVLLETMICFVQTDGDYKKTAVMMNQHINTIRYRMNKIQMILDLEDQNIQFFETISLCCKINNILHGNRFKPSS